MEHVSCASHLKLQTSVESKAYYVVTYNFSYYVRQGCAGCSSNENDTAARIHSDPSRAPTSDAALAPLDRMESHPQIRTVVPDEMYMLASGSALAVL